MLAIISILCSEDTSCEDFSLSFDHTELSACKSGSSRRGSELVKSTFLSPWGKITKKPNHGRLHRTSQDFIRFTTTVHTFFVLASVIWSRLITRVFCPPAVLAYRVLFIMGHPTSYVQRTVFFTICWTSDDTREFP